MLVVRSTYPILGERVGRRETTLDTDEVVMRTLHWFDATAAEV